MKKIITPLLLLCVGAWLGMMLTKSCSKTQIERIEIVKTDTLTITKIDTVTILEPQPYKVTVVDTIYVNSFQNGTDWKVLVQEVKEYRDSTYYARISGINAHLEEWRTYPKTITQYITNTERVVVEPKKWGLYGNAEYRFTSVDSRLCIGAELRYTAPKIEYFIKGGRELINNQSYVEIGTNVPIVRW
jgi:hypothetical protein